MGSDDEIELKLSKHTLEALQGFYQERDAHQKQFEDLKAQAEDDFANKTLSMNAFTEDWNASQFWYTDDTALVLAKVLLDGATNSNSIAVVSAPSVFIQIKNLLATIASEERPRVSLFEFDKRFAIFKEFVRYDYAHPLKLPENLKNAFDRIIIDPPFLSDDCQTKVALTVRALATSWPVDAAPEASEGIQSSQDDTLSAITAKTLPSIVVCTGERMESLILRLYNKLDVKTTRFEVRHSKGLSNEFRCFANCGWGVWEESG